MTGHIVLSALVRDRCGARHIVSMPTRGPSALSTLSESASCGSLSRRSDLRDWLRAAAFPRRRAEDLLQNDVKALHFPARCPQGPQAGQNRGRTLWSVTRAAARPSPRS